MTRIFGKSSVIPIIIPSQYDLSSATLGHVIVIIEWRIVGRTYFNWDTQCKNSRRYYCFALGNVRRPCRMLVALMSLSASCQEGFGHGRSGSSVTGSTWRWNSNKTQSMMRIMRCGGFANLRTAAHTHIT